MSWKKSTFFFIYQSMRYARSWAHFRRIWSYKKPWSASFIAGRNSMTDEQAWLTFGAIDMLKSYLKKDHKLFEYGGGGSTLFFCQRVAQVITVEDHEGWMNNLRDRIKSDQYTNWTGYFIGADLLENPAARAASNPADFKSNVKGYENLSFERYARAIDAFETDFFDVILVDGRARPSCIQQSLPKLKSGGLLVLDNAERAYYTTAFKDLFQTAFHTLLDERLPCPYGPDFTITLILQKK